MKHLRVQDFTRLPGPRYIEEGPFSGQLYRNDHLEPAFEQAVATGEPLHVDLDGMTYGYPASFLEESFGGLARIWTADGHRPRLSEEDLCRVLKLKSDDQPALIDTIYGYIRQANSRKRAQS